jgi:hypothetical protein
MFEYKHYVPILRWKAAERDALKLLKTEHKNIITPLIEFTMPVPKNEKNRKTPTELLQESIDMFLEDIKDIPSQILKCWGNHAIFIDIQLIDGSIRADALNQVLRLGRQLDIFMVPVITVIPVVGFESDTKTRQVAIQFAKQLKNGLCFRIIESNLDEISFSKDFDKFIKENKVDPNKTDLLVDFKIINEETIAKQLVTKINKIPFLEDWRTFIVAGGAFPKDLSHFQKHNQYYVPRSDWAIWQQIVKSLSRKPSFADYAIQHPVYMPPTSGANPSASIRYAAENDWLVLRGEGLRNPKGAKFKQYPAEAKLLFDQKEFKGADFSYGDSYIAEKAADLNTKSPGNPKTWLEAGFNHHMTLVAHQIASLPV